MDSLVTNLIFILSVPDLAVTLVASVIIGVICFFIALHLAEYKDLQKRCLKYLSTTCAISFVSASFMILLNPFYFSEVSSYFIVTKSLMFIGAWILLAELVHAYRYFKKQAEDKGKIYPEDNIRL